MLKVLVLTNVTNVGANFGSGATWNITTRHCTQAFANTSANIVGNRLLANIHWLYTDEYIPASAITSVTFVAKASVRPPIFSTIVEFIQVFLFENIEKKKAIDSHDTWLGKIPRIDYISIFNIITTPNLIVRITGTLHVVVISCLK